jgi:hypothetical protein
MNTRDEEALVVLLEDRNCHFLFQQEKMRYKCIIVAAQP